MGDRTDAAINIWTRLEEPEAEAEALAPERQQSLREPSIEADRAIWDPDEMGLYEYLYADTDVPDTPCSQRPST